MVSLLGQRTESSRFYVDREYDCLVALRSPLSPVIRRKFCGTSRRENGAVTHKQKNFGQLWFEPDQPSRLFEGARAAPFCPRFR
jgi:hypothetical protein